MKATNLFFGLVWGVTIFAGLSAQARDWLVTSPNHEQTFAYGTEQRRFWAVNGSDRHLVLYLDFTNDPFVDRNDPREYDHFSFDFPQVKLGANGHTFYYRTPDGSSVPVAANNIGVDEIKLLPTSYLAIKLPHGYLTVQLLIGDHPFTTEDN